MLHESLGYEVFRAAGVPAPRTGFAYVRVDGLGYGLYLEPRDLRRHLCPVRLFATHAAPLRGRRLRRRRRGRAVPAPTRWRRVMRTTAATSRR